MFRYRSWKLQNTNTKSNFDGLHPQNDERSNFLQKWSSICVNVDHDFDVVQFWINGEDLGSRYGSLYHQDFKSMTVRLGKYYGDNSSLIGKLVDFNMWDRLLTSEEMEKYTKCYPSHPQIPNTAAGNLINPSTQFSVTGSLIEKIDIPSTDIVCQNRTVLIPIRFERMEDAMRMCEILGEEGNYLKPFKNMQEYVELYNHYKTDPTMLKYCDQGGRHILWLPYTGSKRKEGEPSNITYYKTNDQLTMHDAWRDDNGIKKISQKKDFCVVARMGRISSRRT